MGLVYDPLRKEYFSAIAGEGAFLNSKKTGVSYCGALDQSVIARVFL